MKQINLLLVALLAILFFISNSNAQETYKEKQIVDENVSFVNTEKHGVVNYSEKNIDKAPHNVILLIGDGMGVAQIYGGLTANGGDLFMRTMSHIGFSTTYSADKYITDSAAAGTALATGVKTKNTAIGVTADGKPVKNIREYAEENGMKTGVVSTSAITHATPAAFVAHENYRKDYEAIADDFLDTEVDVFIGGGYDHFANRDDNIDLVRALSEKGYSVVQSIESASKIKTGKLAALTAPEHNPSMQEGRGEYLPEATQIAIDLLDNKKNGFFLMVEGSQIDWGGHQNSTTYTISEVLDFDKAVGVALKYAAELGNTLVIVTADHETGGFGVNGGSFDEMKVEGGFTTKHHTATMVPVMAFGPGAKEFQGFYDNTDIFKKIKKLLRFN